MAIQDIGEKFAFSMVIISRRKEFKNILYMLTVILLFLAEKICKVKFKLEFVVCGLIDGHRKLFRVDFIQQQGTSIYHGAQH
jgi:hypothetical protein